MMQSGSFLVSASPDERRATCESSSLCTCNRQSPSTPHSIVLYCISPLLLAGEGIEKVLPLNVVAVPAVVGLFKSRCSHMIAASVSYARMHMRE